MKNLLLSLTLVSCLFPAISFGCNAYLASNSQDMHNALNEYADAAEEAPGYSHFADLAYEASDVAHYMYKKAIRGRDCQYLKNEYLTLSAQYSRLSMNNAMASRATRNGEMMRNWFHVEVAFNALVETFQGE
jgi:hypothetical protein